MKLNESNLVNRPICFLLCGLPGSGKSTWVNKVLASSDKEFVVLSTDNIIEKMAKEVGMTYSQIWSDAIDEATRENYANFKDAVKNKQNIIWDQTNLSMNKRKNVLQNLGPHYEKIAVTFELPLNEIFARVENRAKETGKDIPQSILVNMYKSYVKPTLAEGFNKIIEG